MLEISDEIKYLANKLDRTEAEARQHEILLELMPFCKQIKMLMESFGANWKGKYHLAWKQDFWMAARPLIWEFKMLEGGGKILCLFCGKEVNGKYVMHHEIYPANSYNLLYTLYIDIVHSRCHGNHHKKK